MKIFVEVFFFCKQLKLAMIAGWDFFNTITIVIIFDDLYNNFETTIVSIVKTKNKTIKKIQSIYSPKLLIKLTDQ